MEEIFRSKINTLHEAIYHIMLPICSLVYDNLREESINEPTSEESPKQHPGEHLENEECESGDCESSQSHVGIYSSYEAIVRGYGFVQSGNHYKHKDEKWRSKHVEYWLKPHAFGDHPTKMEKDPLYNQLSVDGSAVIYVRKVPYIFQKAYRPLQHIAMSRNMNLSEAYYYKNNPHTSRYGLQDQIEYMINKDAEHFHKSMVCHLIRKSRKVEEIDHSSYDNKMVSIAKRMDRVQQPVLPSDIGDIIKGKKKIKLLNHSNMYTVNNGLVRKTAQWKPVYAIVKRVQDASKRKHPKKHIKKVTKSKTDNIHDILAKDSFANIATIMIMICLFGLITIAAYNGGKYMSVIAYNEIKTFFDDIMTERMLAMKNKEFSILEQLIVPCSKYGHKPKEECDITGRFYRLDVSGYMPDIVEL